MKKTTIILGAGCILSLVVAVGIVCVADGPPTAPDCAKLHKALKSTINSDSNTVSEQGTMPGGHGDLVRTRKALIESTKTVCAEIEIDPDYIAYRKIWEVWNAQDSRDRTKANKIIAVAVICLFAALISEIKRM